MIAAGERSVPKTGSARALLGIAAAIRATVPAPRFLHADVVGLAVKFLQGVDHFIKLDDVTGTEPLPHLSHRSPVTAVSSHPRQQVRLLLRLPVLILANLIP